jgi:CDP-diacylglycerol--glycerol-3-phosphate 3-phosphatidyltransferase
MSLANAITITRGIAIAPIVILLLTGHRWAAWWLFGFACATDLVDGFVARTRGEVTRMGKVLDPLVDKAMYVAVLFSLYVLGDVPTWAVVVFLIPQVGLGFGALFLRVRSDAVQGARVLGKAAAGLAFVSIAFLLVQWPGGREIFYAAIAATYLAGVDYLISALSIQSTPS